MREHYSRYTPEMVERITGIPRDQFLEVAKLVGEMGRPDKVMTIVYAVGLTHHTTGSQMIRSGAVLQLLLGNIGRPGGGMNAERGHANIQGNTDNAISWEILPGYLRIPLPGQRNLDDYIKLSASKKAHPNSLNFFGENYRNFMVSLLKTWYGDKATKSNEFAFDYIPKPDGNTSWITIFDQALKGEMEGLILSGMTAASIGPDSNQVREGLGKLKWLVTFDAFPTTSSEFWHGPGADPAELQTEVFALPATHWIEKEGSFVNSGRWMQWKDQVLPPEGDARHDHWLLADIFLRVRELYEREGGTFPGPVTGPDVPLPRSGQARVRRGRAGGERQAICAPASGWSRSRISPTTATRRRGTGSTSARYPEAGNMAKRRNGVQDPEKNDPTGMGFYPEWAWSWPANRRVLYNRASADPAGEPWDKSRARDPLGRGAEAVGRRRARLPAGRGPGRSRLAAAVHHDRRGNRPPVLELARGRAVPRALRADRVADREPAPSRGLGVAGGIPLRQGCGAAEPLRNGRRVPLRRHQLSPHRA